MTSVSLRVSSFWGVRAKLCFTANLHDAAARGLVEAFVQHLHLEGCEDASLVPLSEAAWNLSFCQASQIAMGTIKYCCNKSP